MREPGVFDSDQTVEQARSLLRPYLIRQVPKHFWLGVSVEDQKRADQRIPVLQSMIEFTIKFLSVEPLLEDVDLTKHLQAGGIDWVIVGGESHQNGRVRPCDLEWIESIVTQAQSLGDCLCQADGQYADLVWPAGNPLRQRGSDGRVARLAEDQGVPTMNKQAQAKTMIERSLKAYHLKALHSLGLAELDKVMDFIYPVFTPADKYLPLCRICENGIIEIRICHDLFSNNFDEIRDICHDSGMIPCRIAFEKSIPSGDAELYRIDFLWCLNVIAQFERWRECCRDIFFGYDTLFSCTFAGKWYQSYLTPEKALTSAFNSVRDGLLGPTEDEE